MVIIFITVIYLNQLCGSKTKISITNQCKVVYVVMYAAITYESLCGLNIA